SANARTSVTGSFTSGAAVSLGARVVATATDSNGNTSEFSPSVRVLSANESFVVNTLTDEDNDTSDPGFGDGTSLREAIDYANRFADTNTITFDGSLAGIIQLTGTLPAVASNMIIQGPGANVLTVRRNSGGDYRLLTVDAGATVTISGVTFTNGITTGSGIVNNGTLTLRACAFHDNGGAQSERGGAIRNNETLTVEQCTFSENEANKAGGAIANYKTLSVTNSTFSANAVLSVTAEGGSAIHNAAGTATVTNSTFAGNRTRLGSRAAILNNQAVTIGNSLFRQAQGQNINAPSGGVTSQGYNLCNDTCGGFFTATGDQINTDPLVGGLQDNGGPTQTHAPLENSSAVDAGNCAAASTDQRGDARPVSLDNATYPDATNGCDIGAVEIQRVAALPGDLTAFTATLDNGDVLLGWTTASETNNAGFAIEHQAPEQAAWTEVAFVSGAGTTTIEQAYAHRFVSEVPGEHRFRLRQLDFDGSFDYSPEVEVTLEMAETFVLSPVYPNPFNPSAQFSLRVREAQQVSVAVYDALGREVERVFEGELAATRSHAFSVDGSNWASGVYVVRVRGERFVQSQMVSLVK
ncbi:MAG: choice-of-anchor Q domain-containing protein, partial [Bacteroidota bacterium]